MFAFGVARIAQAFGDDVVAEGDVVRGLVPSFVAGTRCREQFVRGPGQRTVVYHDVPGFPGAHAVGLPARAFHHASVAGADADVTDEDVVALDAHFAFYQRDSRSRSRLARDVEIGLLEFQGRSLQIDHSARFEDHDAGTFLPDGPCERSFALFVEVRDADDPEIAVAERRVTFCASGKIGRFPDQCGESFLRCRGRYLSRGLRGLATDQGGCKER